MERDAFLKLSRFIFEKIVGKALARTSYQMVPRASLVMDDRYLDREEFRYILWLDRIYEKIRTVPGHIVELGVARGRNSVLFANLMSLNGEDSVRKYYGFDTFEGYDAADLKTNSWLGSGDWKNTSQAFVEDRVARAGFKHSCHFIPGDIKRTVPEFLEKGLPGFFTPKNLKVALLYIDCNAYEPALLGMNLFRDYMSPGGLICIDEKQQGGETKALLEFCKKNQLPFIKDASPFSLPAYTKV